MKLKLSILILKIIGLFKEFTTKYITHNIQIKLYPLKLTILKKVLSLFSNIDIISSYSKYIINLI